MNQETFSEKYYSTEHSLLIRDCDANGQLRPSVLMELFQEAGGSHCAYVGMGRFDLIRKNIVWVITRMEVQIERWPTLGETIEVKTWHSNMHHMLFPRSYTVADTAGNILIRASSLWALMDLTSRSMVHWDKNSIPFPDNSDMPPALPFPKAPTETEGTVSSLAKKADYSDYDANRHVNNARYMDWCCNALGYDTLYEKNIASFRIQFSREIRPHQMVDLLLQKNENTFFYAGEVNGDSAFQVSGTLKERENV